MEKIFLTYNQQMKRLRDQKSIECKATKDKKLLVRYGYFNLINGYKDAFTSDVDSNNNHVYLPGTDIKHFHILKTFDDDLRLFLLKYITQVEEEVRTLTGYKFDQCNDGKLSWYDIKAYNEEKSLQCRMNAISSAYSELSRSKLDYVQFYKNNHSSIPTWIMIKVVNFSTFINILQSCKKEVLFGLCKLYGMYTPEGKFNIQLLIGSLQWLRKVRNSCAHNERIYKRNNKKGNKTDGRIKEYYFTQLGMSYLKTREKTIMDLIVYFKYYLPTQEYKGFILQLEQMLTKLEKSVPEDVFSYVRGQMGIKKTSDLKKLLDIPKPYGDINYNKYDTYLLKEHETK